MTAPYAQEIAANLARAEESVQAAQVLMAAGYGDFATSRAYYAAFYAATAALLAEEREFSKPQRCDCGGTPTSCANWQAG